MRNPAPAGLGSWFAWLMSPFRSGHVQAARVERVDEDVLANGEVDQIRIFGFEVRVDESGRDQDDISLSRQRCHARHDFPQAAEDGFGFLLSFLHLAPCDGFGERPGRGDVAGGWATALRARVLNVATARASCVATLMA